MLLNNAPVNEAVLSNVGEIGEFRIRNSAKAFNILSSGLYANKIRAIVRELSCNAVDSHVAAGKQDTPFDVHLPNQLEPWFAIRDYGTGLSHEQVSNIYTTYFESTKTNSNDFIGALGLGSKSPFSYTDNFTVTAIKDGIKGIYSAFINEAGVPSIAKMMDEATDEPAGVEVKFSVNDRYDYSKFADEARYVYRYFALRPVVSGISDFQFRDITYKDKDIIPGVHQMDSRQSVAVMGNIAYPIEIPNADSNLGDLRMLLSCGLEMHFAIGELDFQASREGLSYIPQTIASIKRKLEAVNAALSIVIAEKADTFDNKWKRAIWLSKKRDDPLWTAAVTKLVTDTKDPFFETSIATNHYQYGRLTPFKVTAALLAKKYNIELRGFTKGVRQNTCSNMKPDHDYDQTTKVTTAYWRISVQDGSYFVKNDTKIGATERAKYHWRNTPADKDDPYSVAVYVIEAVDKTKPVKYDAFLKAIGNPPNVLQASALLAKERAKNSGSAKNVSILRLEERGGQGYYRSKEVVWRDAGKADSFSTTATHYYLPLSGFNVISKGGVTFSGKDFISDLKGSGFSELHVEVLGVRKGDLEFIKTQKNWVNIEDMIQTVLNGATDDQKMNLAVNSVDKVSLIAYNKNIVEAINNDKSPYVAFVTKMKNASKISFSEYSLDRLCRRYNVNPIGLTALKESIVNECAAVYSRYPLLSSLGYCSDNSAIAEYISLIDTKKGV
jgi:hypothetical protein